jgi:predicted nucleic acid-binding protein
MRIAALAQDLTVVTDNIDEFERINGLPIENRVNQQR